MHPILKTSTPYSVDVLDRNLVSIINYRIDLRFRSPISGPDIDTTRNPRHVSHCRGRSYREVGRSGATGVGEAYGVAEVATWNSGEVDNLDLEHRSDHPLVTEGHASVSKASTYHGWHNPVLGPCGLRSLSLVVQSHAQSYWDDNPDKGHALIDRNSPCETSENTSGIPCTQHFANRASSDLLPIQWHAGGDSTYVYMSRRWAPR